MKRLLPIFIVLLIFASCKTQNQVSDNNKQKKKQDTVKKWTFNRVLKTDDYDIKYSKAFDYFAHEKYSKALDVFEQLVPHEKGQVRGVIVYYYYAMSNYKIGDYLYAGYLFNNFFETYPNTQYSENSLFLSAFCYYLDSPRWSLDQGPTNDAINQFQLFLSKYPDNTLIDSTNFLIDTLRYKLEEKAFRNSKLYFDLEIYKSADIALTNAMKDFPGSSFNDEALYYLVKSNFDYASESIREKQKERFIKTLSECLRYKQTYPKGHYLKDVEKIIIISEKKIKHL